MTEIDGLFSGPPDVTLELLDTVLVQPGVFAEVIELVPGMSLLDTFRRFGVALDAGEHEDVEYRISLC